MQSVAVIKHRYVIQDILLGFIPALVVPPANTFLLQAAKEALDHRIVPTIALATHTADSEVFDHQAPVGLTGVRCRKIAVMDQIRVSLSA